MKVLRAPRLPKLPAISLPVFPVMRLVTFPWRVLCAQGRALRASPYQVYLRLGRTRDWITGKIEYLNTESAKWRALFNMVKAPYSLLRGMGLNPQMAAGLLVTASAVGSGVVVNETLLEGRSFSRGDSGVYAAPSDAPVTYIEGDNTLRVDLSTVPVSQIKIENVTVGTAYPGSALPAGETSAVLIGGVATSTGFTATWLEVGYLTFDRSQCDSFELSDTEVHTLNVVGNSSDGQSVGPIPGTPRRRGIGGGNRADDMNTSNSTYDQIKIQATSSGIDGQVAVLTLSNLLTSGGSCKLSRIRADTIDILLNTVGLGNGFATKEFVVATSTVWKVFTNVDNVEVSISPP